MSSDQVAKLAATIEVMSSDQVAKLAATIEVLTGAVRFLLAERVSMQPDAVQGELLRVLQRSFSTPPRRPETLIGRAAIAQADLALWMPIVATNTIDDVRRQIGREPEGVTHIAPADEGSSAAPDGLSEMTERTRREDAHVIAIGPEGGRAVA